MNVKTKLSKSAPARIVAALAGITLFAVLLIIGATECRATDQTVENECDDCLINYVFNCESCTLTRFFECGVNSQACFTMPGQSSSTCRRIAENMQGGISSVSTEFGTASVTKCVQDDDGVWSCGDGSVTCEVTYLKPKTPKDANAGDHVYGELLDDEGNVLLRYASQWNAREIEYTVSNNLDEDITVDWANTPVHGMLIAAHTERTSNFARGKAAVVTEFSTIAFEFGTSGDRLELDYVVTVLESRESHTTDVSEYSEEQGFVLGSNSPNPFAGATTLYYELPYATIVELSIHDALGAEIRRLHSGMQEKGTHSLSWDSLNENGQSLATGTYFYRLKALDAAGNPLVLSRQMMLIR